MTKKLIAIAVFLIYSSFLSLSQELPEQDPFAYEGDYDSPLTIDLEKEEDENKVTPKKKKHKKNVYYGLKTKKGYTKTVKGDNVIIEFFSYLKAYQAPDPYVRDIYWYNFKKKKISNSRKIDQKNGVILHGPYKKLLGEQVLEEGIFYVGTKHGRWTKHNKNDVLVDKEKYYKGWPKESKLAFHDRERTKLKEVIPIEYGEKEGYYYYFHENGLIAAMGEYKFDAKVGIWNEFYNKRRRRKRQVKYSEDPFDKESRPYILKEWNENGKLIYDRKNYF